MTTFALSGLVYLGSVSQPVAATLNDGILTDTTKKEKKPVKKSDSEEATSDSTKTEK